MSDAIDIEGKEYVSAKRASKETGYTRDYIGQLARGGHIAAHRVEGLWYVSLESLNAYRTKAEEYKPHPPIPPPQDIDTSVTFDGKDFVSASRGAKITGYHQDYVSQLARTGKVESRQVGSRWFVCLDALVAHKKEKDALLAAVQAESVGLSGSRDAESAFRQRVPTASSHYENQWAVPERPAPAEPFFTYTAQKAQTLPDISAEVHEATPLRVRTLPAPLSRTAPATDMHSAATRHAPPLRMQPVERRNYQRPQKGRSIRRALPLAGVALTIVVVLTFSFTGLREHAVYAIEQLKGTGAGAQSASAAAGGSGPIQRAAEWIEAMFAHDIEYKAPAK